MQSFIISHSSCAEQYGDMSSNTQTHTFTHIDTLTGGQERNLLVVPIVSKTMSEANYFTPSTENDHRSACCQKHPASIVSFNCEGLSEEKEVLIVEMCRTNSYVALCLQETHRTANSRQISINGYSVTSRSPVSRVPCPALPSPPLPSLPPSLPRAKFDQAGSSQSRYSECAHVLTWPHSE